MIASTNIKAGSLITSSYVEPNFGTLERREYLLENFYFSCKCRRCKDPSEFGSFLSGVKCSNKTCKNGWFLSKNPLDHNSDWICNKLECGVSIDPSFINDILQEVKLKMIKAKTVNNFADILGIYKEKILHKNHYLVINMEFEIIRLIHESLGKADETEILRLAKYQVELCRHCLSVADLIQPGSSKFRGYYYFMKIENENSLFILVF